MSTMTRLREALVEHFGPAIDQIDDVTPLFTAEADTQIGRALGDALDRVDLAACIECAFELPPLTIPIDGSPTLASLVSLIDEAAGA